MTGPRVRTAILISGRGSNMRALIAAARDPAYPAEIALVVSNRPDAPGLEHARRHGIATAVVDHRTHAGREAFEAALHACLLAHQIAFIACAGFMRMLTPWFVRAWQGRMINIHPALLPAYKGLHTHTRALADAAVVHGCTVHWVSDELDSGAVILKAEVPVIPGDTPETLAARVLVEEHRIYPEALRQVAGALSSRLAPPM